MNWIIPNLWTFLALTLILGGAAAFVSGRSIAAIWRSALLILIAMAPLTLATRFLHYALFDEATTWANVALCFTILTIFAFIGFYSQRSKQMRTHYPWLYKI